MRTEPEIMTYRDLFDILVHSVAGLPDQLQEARVSECIDIAIRGVVHEREWKYFREQGRIQLAAPQTGEISTYTATTPTQALPVGGYIDLVGETWPAWAAQGRVRFDAIDVEYIAYSRASDTKLYLAEGHAPDTTVEVTAGDGYTIYRTVYPLPGDMVKLLGTFHDEGNWWGSYYLMPDEWLGWTRQHPLAEGGQFKFTIMGDPNYLGQMALVTYGWPEEAQTLDFMYQRRERPVAFRGIVASEGATGYTLSGSSETNPTTGKSQLTHQYRFRARPPIWLPVFGHTASLPSFLRNTTSLTPQSPTTKCT